jgi:hypothetical protein
MPSYKEEIIFLKNLVEALIKVRMMQVSSMGTRGWSQTLCLNK